MISENKFVIPAFFVLVLFYGIYFGKEIAQKQKGIRTRQLGRRKEIPIRTTEILLTAATCLVVIAQLISVIWNWNFMPEAVRAAGAIVAFLGDLVFLTAVITMKDSWRAGIPEKDRTSLVSGGIYQYSRNPAFLGFDLMYAGILLMYFNWILLFFTGWAVVMLHLQILQEEKFLPSVFGEEYLAYKKRTKRYVGKKRR